MTLLRRPDDLVDLEAELHHVRAALLAAETEKADEIAASHPSHRRSATNLVHYVELRNHDIRDLQSRLRGLGLSSLGRSESNVLAAIDAVLTLLARLNGHAFAAPGGSAGVDTGHDLLAANADRLLGRAVAKRSTRIMVTLPSEAGDDAQLVAGLFAKGMDVARVNCAHDDAAAWVRMIDHVRASSATDGRRCRVAMDLGGPKLRTGPLQDGPRSVRVAPERDHLGRVVTPARVWLSAGDGLGDDADRTITDVPVDDTAWVHRRRSGDRLEIWDSRGSRRHWEVLETGPGGCFASTGQTTYVSTGLKLSCQTEDGEDVVSVGELPVVEQVHRVQRGDQVILTRSLAPAPPTRAGDAHSIGCTIGAVFDHARPGERVWLDDGKFGGLIDRVDHERIVVTVTEVRPGGANLKAAKGINLPDTDLHLDALTAQDLEDLAFAATHADFVNVSFVRRPEDVQAVQHELVRLGAVGVGIVLKIENVAAFECLPELLLQAMRSENVGVMIARGDLAVEVGFDRLAEVQEEIMWACEAARVPLIWAIEVLDRLARTGRPSRAEITDAAMSERAECVMLNKGPYIAEAITALDSILVRMQDHQDKKRSLLRRLRAWDHPVAAGSWLMS